MKRQAVTSPNSKRHVFPVGGHRPISDGNNESPDGANEQNVRVSAASDANDLKTTVLENYVSKSKEKSENILVFARVRPVNGFEKSKNAAILVECLYNREVVVREKLNPSAINRTFTFDRVFGPLAKQIDVYRAVVFPLLEEVLRGYNCTVFAYGQTGTGKTFTMEGERSISPNGAGVEQCTTWESDPLAGIVPRTVSQLFDELRVTNSEFTVRVSLLELYNEEVYDLLACTDDAKPRTVRLYEDGSRKGSVHIQGLEEIIVHNKHEVYAIMERGSQMRKTASTLLNANSSRSHTVFTVTVHIKETSSIGEELLKIGKLHLVDLAGSENIGRSGAVDKRAREAGNINQSLLTLGRVITALVEKAPHIPYRESKLTRLLQDSLGGKTKTSIIATVSPSSSCFEETLSTLDYANRAKNIQNRPEVNQKLTKKAILREYTEEIERLRRDLIAAREKNGIFMEKENYDSQINQIESLRLDLTDKIQHIKSVDERLRQKETEVIRVNTKLTETKNELNTTNMEIDNLKKCIAELQEKVSESETRFRQGLTEKLQHIQNLTEQLQQKETALIEMNAKWSETKEELNVANVETRDLKISNDNLKAQLTETENGFRLHRNATTQYITSLEGEIRQNAVLAIEINVNLGELKEELSIANVEILSLKAENEKLKAQLTETENRTQEMSCVLKVHSEKEEELALETTKLLNVASGVLERTRTLRELKMRISDIQGKHLVKVNNTVLVDTVDTDEINAHTSQLDEITHSKSEAISNHDFNQRFSEETKEENELLDRTFLKSLSAETTPPQLPRNDTNDKMEIEDSATVAPTTELETQKNQFPPNDVGKKIGKSETVQLDPLASLFKSSIKTLKSTTRRLATDLSSSKVPQSRTYWKGPNRSLSEQANPAMDGKT